MLRTFGYIDPGTGATLMQLALAGTVGIGAIVRLKWNSIRSLRRGSGSEQAELSATEAMDSEPRERAPLE